MKRAIVIGGEKGGTGKSTIAVNIGVMSTLLGNDTVLIDSDKNTKSLSKFISHRNDKGIVPTPSCFQIYGQSLHVEIEKLIEKYNIVIIDVGGADSVELRSALSSPFVTDLYSPVQTSDFDLETLESIDELTYLSQSYNKNLKTHIIFNLCSSHPSNNLVVDATELIEQFDHITRLPPILTHRVAFSYSISHHQSVVEFERSKMKSMPKYQSNKYSAKASKEMIALYNEMMKEKFNIPEFNAVLFNEKELMA